ncbi:PR domain zinc finger protein 13 [Halotydeus destructor]|nr:PR domain zinc finger protein 13 [Halotydeus destructor]
MSLPFTSTINLRKIFEVETISAKLRATVNQLGLLTIDQHVDWIPQLRLAQDCQEQNGELQLVQNSKAVQVRTTRKIEAGEEIKVWLSVELLAALEIPFLRPENIFSHQAYKCSNCNRTYTHPNPLKVHLAFECSATFRPCEPVATMDRQGPPHTFPGLLVAANSPMSISTSRHEYSVTKEPKTHECMFCGKLYTRKYGLKIHLRTHTGHKPLQCRHCGRPFSDPSNLNKHIRLHAHNGTAITNSTPYQCHICKKVLVRRRDLDRHIKSRHGEVSIT